MTEPPSHMTLRLDPTAQAPKMRAVPTFLRLSVVTRDSVGAIGPHRHEEHEMILIERGLYDCQINDHPIHLAPGEGVVVKPGDWHEDHFPEDAPLRYLAVAFRLFQDSGGGAESTLFREGTAPDDQRFHLDHDDFWPLIDGILHEGERDDPMAPQVQHAMLLALLWRTLRALPAAALHPAFMSMAGQHALQSQLQALFDRHLGEDLTVSDMAQYLHMSESSLAHSCKQALGISPRRAYLQRKMQHAAYLLRNTRLSVAAVALALGYDDPTTFSRVFRREFGQPPGRWRRGNC